MIDARVLQFLLQLANARDGSSTIDLWWNTEDGYQCRLCRMVIKRGFGTAFNAEMMHDHLQDEGHDRTAAYLIDNDLHVLVHNCQDRLQRLDFGIDTLCDIGAAQACGVLVGPKWFKDLIGGWCSDALIRKVVKRVEADPEFRDALTAVSDMPDGGDAVDVLVAHQFPGEMFIGDGG